MVWNCLVSGYDSDVAREKNMDYTTKIYTDPIRKKTGIKPHEQEYEEEEKWVIACVNIEYILN